MCPLGNYDSLASGPPFKQAFFSFFLAQRAIFYPQLQKILISLTNLWPRRYL